jgi:hypothetical protein
MIDDSSPPASNRPRTAAIKLLQRYFPETLTLEAYLHRSVREVKLIEEGDDSGYCTLIRNGWVGIDQSGCASSGGEIRVFDNQQPSELQADVRSSSSIWAIDE